MKKIFINNKVYDVIDPQTYHANKEYYDEFSDDIAIEVNGYAYPLQHTRQPNKPGIVDKGVWFQIYPPASENMQNYSINNILDFGSAKDLSDIASLNEQYMNMERDIATDPNDNFKPPIKLQDSPEMTALKEAVCTKNINIKSYKKRFGPTFENDIRIFNGHKITLRKMREMCNALDIEAILTLRDASGDVENPMGTEISVNITGDDKKEEL